MATFDVRKYERDIVFHTRQLIRIRSVQSAAEPGKPYGEGVYRALRYMLDLGESMRFRVTEVDGYAGHVEYGSGKEIVGVLTHVDTVPEGTGWTYPPLEGVVEDGGIYGRGAADNKSAAVAALYSLLALRESGVVPDRRIRIIFGTNEENGMTDMDYYFAKEPLPDYGFVTDGPYPIVNAEKGSLVVGLRQKLARGGSGWIAMNGGEAPNLVPESCFAFVYSAGKSVLEMSKRGRSAHGAFPDDGLNAIVLLLADLFERPEMLEAEASGDSFLRLLYERIGRETNGESLGLACRDEEHGALTVNLAQIRLDRNQAFAVLNIRYPVSANGEEVMAKLKRGLLSEAADSTEIEVEVLSHLEPVYVAPGHELIRRLSRAYEKATGEPAKLISMAGGTYAKKLRNRGVTFGHAFQGTDSRFHQADERVVVEELMRHAEICTLALYELCKDEGEMEHDHLRG